MVHSEVSSTVHTLAPPMTTGQRAVPRSVHAAIHGLPSTGASSAAPLTCATGTTATCGPHVRVFRPKGTLGERGGHLEETVIRNTWSVFTTSPRGTYLATSRYPEGASRSLGYSNSRPPLTERTATTVPGRAV